MNQHKNTFISMFCLWVFLGIFFQMYMSCCSCHETNSTSDEVCCSNEESNCCTTTYVAISIADVETVQVAHQYVIIDRYFPIHSIQNLFGIVLIPKEICLIKKKHIHPPPVVFTDKYILHSQFVFYG